VVFPERTVAGISLMIAFAVNVLEQMWAWNALLGFKPRWINLVISFTTPHEMMVMFN